MAGSVSRGVPSAEGRGPSRLCRAPRVDVGGMKNEARGMSLVCRMTEALLTRTSCLVPHAWVEQYPTHGTDDSALGTQHSALSRNYNSDMSTTTDSAFLRAFGDRIRAERARRGMSRKLLAHHAGISERYITQIESGKGN